MWFFYSPTIIFGEGSLDHLENIEGDKVFIVTDEMLVKLKVVDIVTNKLKEYGKQWKIFSEVEPDPHEDTILKAAKACQEYKPNLIIGLGGGSSLDAAKGVWVMYERPDLVIDDMHPFMKMGLGKKAKLVAIPTTSGTGAETTWAIIITRILADGSHIKLEQANKEVIPTYALIDPIFTKGLPPKLTAATGFDALAHTLESLIATWRNDFSDGMAYKAFDLIHTYLARAFKDGNDMEARNEMHIAATLAGLAFGNSQAIMGHSLGHALGAAFGITHGVAVGLYLPYIMEYSVNDPDKQDAKNIYAKFAKATSVANWSDSADVACKKLIAVVKALQKEVKVPTTLKELNITKVQLEAKLDIMAQQCMESSVAVMSPRAADSEMFKKIMIYAFEGKAVDF
jgi:alcohol dehydrogenase class IV